MTLRVHPARPLAPIFVAAAIVGTWWVVAHNSGSGWVQALGDVVFGVLFIGIVGPSLVLARAKIHLAAAPLDGTAGLTLDLTIRASTRLRVSPADPPGPEAFIGPTRRRGAGEERVTVLPDQRGVHHFVTLRVATAAPFGLQWWAHRVRVGLPAPLHVAPRRGQPEPLPRWVHEQLGESVQRVPTDSGEPRGVRPYRSGDDRRHVNWAATAHAAELMLRELEEPAAEPVRLTVVLPLDPEQGERVAERALGTVVVLLERGAAVILATTESSGPVVASVADRRGAGRRLARAVSQPGASAGAGIAMSR
ncbi:MAG TPA: DUF58 domain-containing protein [Acidimicrobiales bacterium]|jgi:uncharacterized protein (DUF58 family)|nr:DUF58 domain-containing protein [Acidimicrobiales bacterium]